jgi:hypothetical protein
MRGFFRKMRDHPILNRKTLLSIQPFCSFGDTVLPECRPDAEARTQQSDTDCSVFQVQGAWKRTSIGRREYV